MTQSVYKHIDVYEISGQDAMGFLNNQIISTTTADQGVQFTAICNPKGRIVFTLMLQIDTAVVLAAVDRSLSDNFLQYVNMRRFRMDLNIKKVEKSVAFNRSNSGDIQLSLLDKDADHQAIDQDQFWRHMFDLQLPWITAHTTEQFIPQHLNLDQNGCIDFNKGCYPGQEIIARLHFLGQVKKRMQLISYQNDHPYPAGETIQLPPDHSKAELCAPSLRDADHWQTQAVVPVPKP